MSSLYSAQIVAEAMEQVEKQHAAKQHNTSTKKPEENATGILNNHEKEHHIYIHKHHNVHQKCLQRGHEEENLLHKRPHQNMDLHLNEGKEKPNKSDSNLSKLLVKRDQTKNQMKNWVKFIQQCLKGEQTMTEAEFHQQRAAFYKWIIFIEELFKHYQSSLGTQTSIHNMEGQQLNLLSSKVLQKQECPSPKNLRKNEGFKLPVINPRNKIEVLEHKVSQLERQLEFYQQNNKKSIKQIEELSLKAETWELRAKKINQNSHKLEQSMQKLISETQQLDTKVITIINGKQNITEIRPLVQQHLKKLKDFKQNLKVQKTTIRHD